MDKVSASANPLPHKPGVYAIILLQDGRCYIGSTGDLHRRRWNHINELTKGKHHSSYLQRAWDKYGPDAFDFSILEMCPEPICIPREQFWIDHFEPAFNVVPVAGSVRGIKRTAEQMAPARAANRGKRYMLGYKHTDEARAKISASKLGKPRPDLKGVPRSDEVRAKISASNTGKRMSPETIAKLSPMRKQLRHTDDTKRRMKESQSRVPPVTCGDCGMTSTPAAMGSHFKSSRHTPGPPPPGAIPEFYKSRPQSNQQYRLSDDDVRAIRNEWTNQGFVTQNGPFDEVMANQFGVSKGTIFNIRTGKYRSDVQ